MLFLNHSYEAPADNLAWEEAALEWAEESGTQGILRLWESPTLFVVLGYGKQAAAEVHLDACRRDGVPVLRRCSGGGTVLQGPGCLNYCLILPIAAHPALETITGANHHIMVRQRDLLRAASSLPVEIDGHTDLRVGDRKCCGNAQRRKRAHILFHGSILLNFDLGRIADYLQLPEVQPAYRNGRTHADFLANLGLNPQAAADALQAGWAAVRPFEADLADEIQALREIRYDSPEWNLR